ncbi:hypothetical protein HMN09_01296800 [Mycena chlorophos]|uniref:NAD(P)-binding protein n=1 Tax=Mycena chlorophos TaxID=658473 RepID=A0A8H6VUC8_MYCCL|nr:hypothetical protein HMN09_01296800 [Mycena chlorophos]
MATMITNAAILLSTLAIGFRMLSFLRQRRSARLPRARERVLIIGASSGIGRTLAQHYAALGVKGLGIVGRRADKLAEVAKECEERCVAAGTEKTEVLALAGDFAEVADMVRIRDELLAKWDGIDTIIVAAGVSALRPLLDIAQDKPGAEGIQRVVDVASLATRGNYIGPLVAAVTFIPLLESSSPSPSILLVNSLASVIPAPTRSIYASTKAASLKLYQALAIEHPHIAFTQFMPSTVEGDFRASAVDGGTARESDPNKTGLKREDVARRCLDAIDYGEKHVWMPWTMGPSHIVYWLFPRFVESRASKKYHYTPPPRPAIQQG